MTTTMMMMMMIMIRMMMMMLMMKAGQQHVQQTGRGIRNILLTLTPMDLPPFAAPKWVAIPSFVAKRFAFHCHSCFVGDLPSGDDVIRSARLQ